MQALINPAYPNRIQLSLGSLTGPFSDPFDPREALEVYVDGLRRRIESYAFDGANNRYLFFTASAIDMNAVVQVIYHIPTTPFTAGATTVPGFALLASVDNTPDVIHPAVGLSIPASVAANTPFPLTWSAVGVAAFQITTTTGFETTRLSALAAAGVVYCAGIGSTGSFTATITAYDANGDVVSVNGATISTTVPLNVVTG